MRKAHQGAHLLPHPRPKAAPSGDGRPSAVSNVERHRQPPYLSNIPCPKTHSPTTPFQKHPATYPPPPRRMYTAPHDPRPSAYGRNRRCRRPARPDAAVYPRHIGDRPLTHGRPVPALREPLPRPARRVRRARRIRAAQGDRNHHGEPASAGPAPARRAHAHRALAGRPRNLRRAGTSPARLPPLGSAASGRRCTPRAHKPPHRPRSPARQRIRMQRRTPFCAVSKPWISQQHFRCARPRAGAAVRHAPRRPLPARSPSCRAISSACHKAGCTCPATSSTCFWN